MNDIAILVVDDDAPHGEMLAGVLAERCERGRIALVAAADEAKALLGLAPDDTRRPPLPRLVLLSADLAGGSIELLRAIRRGERTAALPVVMLSSSGDRRELDRCYEAGANSVVRKGADAAETRQKMLKVHDFWMTTNEVHRSSRV